LRQVSRFRAWSPVGRRAKVAADSLRLAGNKALGQSGVVAALRLWRESVRRAAGIGDTAGIAAGLGNIGKGFYELRELDSAEAYWSRSVDLAERVGDVRTAGNAVGNLASIQKDRGDRPLRSTRGDYAGAVAALTASLAIYEVTGPAHEVAAARRDLADVRAATGDLQGARRELERAETALRRVGDPDAELLARLALTRGDLALLLN